MDQCGMGASPMISGTRARRPCHVNSSCCCRTLLEHSLRFLDVIEVSLLLPDDLIILMTLAREEDNVPFLGVGQNPLNRPAAVHFDYRAFSDAQRSAAPRCFHQGFSCSARQLYIG